MMTALRAGNKYKVSCVIFLSDEQNQIWKWASAWSNETEIKYIKHLFLNLLLLKMGIMVGIDVDQFDPFLKVDLMIDFSYWW